jgi:hypothetical protein
VGTGTVCRHPRQLERPWFAAPAPCPWCLYASAPELVREVCSAPTFALTWLHFGRVADDQPIPSTQWAVFFVTLTKHTSAVSFGVRRFMDTSATLFRNLNAPTMEGHMTKAAPVWPSLVGFQLIDNLHSSNLLARPRNQQLP